MNDISHRNRKYFQSNALLRLIQRNILIFFRNKEMVFFSILSPLIVLVLYILFLSDLQINALESALPTVFNIDKHNIRSLVDTWLIAGVLSVSCITVAFNSMSTMVADKENKVYHDLLASPVKSSIALLGYYISSVIITILIALFIFFVGILYLIITKSFYLTFGEILETILIIILSTLSASMIAVVISNLFRSQSGFGGFNGIISAVIGFLVGAYMPITTFPTALQYIANILPGSHSAGLFRNVLMNQTIINLSKDLPAAFQESIEESYSMSLNYFGNMVNQSFMYIYLILSIIIFFSVYLLIIDYKPHKKST